MFEKIQLFDFIFELKLDKDGVVTSSNFTKEGLAANQLSEDDLREGSSYQQDIFSGKYDWLIRKSNIITLPTHNILVTVEDPIYDGSVKFSGGAITSSLKETCPHCQDTDCDFDCPDAHEWASSRDIEDCQDNLAELASQRNYNFACDAIESMVLGHAVAGVNIETVAYLEGLEAAINAVANHF